MGKPKLKLADETPPRSPKREQLADAIEHYNATALHRDRLKEALKRSEAQLYGDGGALHTVETAETALAEARKAEAAHLASIALGEATEDANPVKAAERAVTEAQSGLDSARKTKDALKEQAKAAEDDLQYATRDLDRCIRAVLREEAGAVIDRTLAEAAALQEQLGAKRAMLSFLKDACFDADRELMKPINDFLAAPAYPWEFHYKREAHPALDPWKSTVAALRLDADAPLPA